ncbi:hypothetical protein F5Y00DRAFT_262557 [Daldinia vernicosa]|uniref:uncharacterized protein n=1 Tax=Daldinia vernicosa TaxID=114800 RepID=UPI0020072F0E|nr:uncharacterized protein F5Y00DRAFT_262557 [Daldinia vernicosa]KAI0848463.1 hypothetical protein F5Y00DRAFT_262557 [Daldinia vernicosa]
MAPKRKGQYVPHLRHLMFLDFLGGLKWETQPQEEYDPQDNSIVKKYHFLLHHPHSFHISKSIVRHLGTKNPLIISLALADIYEFAAENVECCHSLEPEEFFARAKNSFDWSTAFNDKAWWAFTYKAFHARAIFLNTALHPDEKAPPGQPLARALDIFREAFLDCYPLDPAIIHKKGEKICQENIEYVEDELSFNKEIHERYFPHHLTHHDGKGDGTDKIVYCQKVSKASWYKPYNTNGMTEDDLDMSKVPDDELFFYDVECKSKHHNAYKDPSSTKQYGTSKEKESTKGDGLVRKYDAFKEYREETRDDDISEPDISNEGGRVLNDDDDGDGDGMPNIKKLKIADDVTEMDKDGDEGVPDIKKLHLEDTNEEVSAP